MPKTARRTWCQRGRPGSDLPKKILSSSKARASSLRSRAGEKYTKQAGHKKRSLPREKEKQREGKREDLVHTGKDDVLRPGTRIGKKREKAVASPATTQKRTGMRQNVPVWAGKGKRTKASSHYAEEGSIQSGGRECLRVAHTTHKKNSPYQHTKITTHSQGGG